MSVSATHYVVIGVSMTKEEFEKQLPPCPADIYPDDWSCLFLEGYKDNGYREEVTSKHGLTCIYDGMGGRYVVIGKVIAKACKGDGLPMTKLATKPGDVVKIVGKIKKHLGMESKNVGVFAFTHWH